MKVEILRADDQTLICLGGDTVARILPCDGAEDSFCEIEEGVFHWTRKTREPVSAMRMEAVLLGGADFTMVPGVSYNGNGWGNTPEYVGDRFEGTPWTFASHRVTIPSCTYSENGAVSLALMAEAEDSSACSLYAAEAGEVHALLFPEEEGPKTLQRHFWGEPFYGTMEPRTYFTAILMVKPSDGGRFRYRDLLDFAWRYYGHPIAAPMPAKEIYRLSIAFSRYLFEREQDGFAAFTTGAQWHMDGTTYRKTEHTYELGWVGQSASIANAFIWDFLNTGDCEKLDRAIEAHDSWLREGQFPAGHFAARIVRDPWRYEPFDKDYVPDRWKCGECDYEMFKGFAGRKFRRAPDGRILLTHDACNTGTGAEGYFEAYELLQKCGIDKPAYKAAALRACDFILQNQDADGSLVKSWDDDGNVLTKKGTIAAFLILPLITANRLTGDARYLDGAVRAFDYYYSALECDGFTTAGALDTYCIDKESASPLLRAALMLYDRTGARRYVDAAEKIAWYLCTWMMHFTVHYPAGSVLAQMGYDTFGSTSVSTAHQALDQYALRDVLSFLRLYELTGAVQWRERALAFWCNACQCISDGTQYINGRLRPAGAQDEAIFHTRWGRYGVPPFGPSQWLPAWPCAFRLENLRFHPDWSIFDAGLTRIQGEISTRGNAAYAKPEDHANA